MDRDLLAVYVEDIPAGDTTAFDRLRNSHYFTYDPVVFMMIFLHFRNDDNVCPISQTHTIK